MQQYVDGLIDAVKAKNPGEPEFLQAVEEVAGSLQLVFERHPEYKSAAILERMVEPERVLMFRVPWVDDQGVVQVNRGFRIEMNSAIGPYKGGLRFHPSVNLSILKFLAFEQVFKNSLTTLPMGGGKGGSDFNPKGRSDNEVMRFCQSFMTELHRHIGPNTDVPAGDIGVGGREIGLSLRAVQAAGERVLGRADRQGAELGRLADPARGDRLRRGVLRPGDAEDPRRDLRGQDLPGLGQRQRGPVRGREAARAGGQGRDPLRLQRVRLRRDRHRRGEAGLRDGPEEQAARPHQRVRGEVLGLDLHATDAALDHNPLWGHNADCAFPCATQNEINGKDAKNLLDNGVMLVSEGANMPTEAEGVHQFLAKGILYGPGKAANAGGVAVSGLEMAQNSMRYSWHREEVDQRLQMIMADIHEACVGAAERFGTPGNYVNGANIAGFLKVADSMMDQGIV